MFRRNDRRREPRRKTEWSESLVLPYEGKSGDIFFHPADEATKKAFFANLKDRDRNPKFDEGNFKEMAAQAKETIEVGNKQYPILTLDHLRSALKAGETLFTGYELDGSPRNCGICGQKYQPVKRPYQHADGTPAIGGGFSALKAEKLAELIGKGGELAERVKTSSEALTREVMGDQPVPSRAQLLPTCKECSILLGVPNFALETAKEGLLFADKRIGAAADRHEAAAILGRPQRHAVGAGPSDGRYDNRRGGSRGNRRDERSQKPHRDWHGADLEEPTAEALDKHGYLNLADALAAANSGKLMEQGIAHPGSIGPITFALKRASEGRQVAGQARGAALVRRQFSAPGAGRPAKARGRGKRPEFVAPARGNKRRVGLTDLRE